MDAGSLLQIRNNTKGCWESEMCTRTSARGNLRAISLGVQWRVCEHPGRANLWCSWETAAVGSIQRLPCPAPTFDIRMLNEPPSKGRKHALLALDGLSFSHRSSLPKAKPWSLPILSSSLDPKPLPLFLVSSWYIPCLLEPLSPLLPLPPYVPRGSLKMLLMVR